MIVTCNNVGGNMKYCRSQHPVYRDTCASVYIVHVFHLVGAMVMKKYDHVQIRSRRICRTVLACVGDTQIICAKHTNYL